MPMRSCGKIISGLSPLLLLLVPGALDAQVTNGRPVLNTMLITNMAQFWTLPTEENLLLRHQLECILG